MQADGAAGASLQPRLLHHHLHAAGRHHVAAVGAAAAQREGGARRQGDATGGGPQRAQLRLRHGAKHAQRLPWPRRLHQAGEAVREGVTQCGVASPRPPLPRRLGHHQQQGGGLRHNGGWRRPAAQQRRLAQVEAGASAHDKGVARAHKHGAVHHHHEGVCGGALLHQHRLWWAV